MTVIEKLQEKYPFLTRKQREVVDYMLDDPERMSYITLKELSRAARVTEMTILKTCTLLGFSSFSTLKYEFRKYAAQQLELLRHKENEYPMPPAPDYELDDPHRLLQEICSEEAKLTSLFFQRLDLYRLSEAAELILNAGYTVLCGRGVSYNICDYFAMRLATLGQGVVTVNSELDDSIHEALPLLRKNSLLVAVSFPDYYRVTTKVAEYASRKGAKVLGITDSAKSPILPFCNMSLIAPTQTRMFLNTIGTPMMLVNLLTCALHIRLSAEKRNFGANIEEFYALFPERWAGDAGSETRTPGDGRLPL